MHYLLVGPGALGSLLYTLLSKGIAEGNSLTILDYNRNRADLLSQQGIVYHTGNQVEEEGHRVAVNVVSDPSQLTTKNAQPVDVVLLCVKSYDVLSSLQHCEPLLNKSTLLIFLQNGIGHLEIKNFQCNATAAYGTTTEGATLLEPGHVRHAGSGETFLGFLKDPGDHFEALLNKTCDAFVAGGIKAQVIDNILTRIWTKLFINVGINALTATLGCKNGELLTLPGAADRMKTAVSEAVQIAAAKSIPILGDPYEMTREVCNKTAGNVSSMLQDVRRQRRTEIDAINGAIVALGEKLAIETPENLLLKQQVKEIEAAYNR